MNLLQPRYTRQSSRPWRPFNPEYIPWIFGWEFVTYKRDRVYSQSSHIKGWHYGTTMIMFSHIMTVAVQNVIKILFRAMCMTVVRYHICLLQQRFSRDWLMQRRGRNTPYRNCQAQKCGTYRSHLFDIGNTGPY